MEQKISVIVPVYNAQNSLDRCIQSLLNQTYTNIEILLVNDGSRDDSLEICQRYAQMDPRIVVLDKPNGGVSSARNAGLDAAKGEFVMFCDSDDWVEPDWCSTLYENRQPDGLSVCQVDGPSAEDEAYSVDSELLERNEYMHRPMMMCSPVNKLFSKAIIDRYNLRFVNELRLGEDFCFCMAYLSCVTGKICYIYRRLYHYVVTSEESLTKSVPTLEQCERFYQELTESMNRIGITDEQSMAHRDTFTMINFERFLAKSAECSDISLKEKLSIAQKVEHMEAFRSCCENGVKWGNPLYIWLMRNNKVRWAMVFLVIRYTRNRLNAKKRR